MNSTKVKKAKSKGRIKKSRLKKSGIVKKQAHASSRTKRSQSLRDKK